MLSSISCLFFENQLKRLQWCLSSEQQSDRIKALLKRLSCLQSDLQCKPWGKSLHSSVAGQLAPCFNTKFHCRGQCSWWIQCCCFPFGLLLSLLTRCCLISVRTQIHRNLPGNRCVWNICGCELNQYMRQISAFYESFDPIYSPLATFEITIRLGLFQLKIDASDVWWNHLLKHEQSVCTDTESMDS